MNAPLLAVENLRVTGRNGRVLVESAGFSIDAGQTLAIVGASGAGKTVSVLAALGLLPQALSVTGTISWKGTARPADSPRPFSLGRDVVLLTQNPMGAFDPLVRIGRQLIETVACSRPGARRQDLREEIIAVLGRLGFADAATVLERYPCELSGGMLQRCMTAVVLLLKPGLIVADEPTAALDIFSADAVLDELASVQAETHSALIIITHDLAGVAARADSVCVVSQGRTVETLPVEDIARAKHPFTRRLFASALFADTAPAAAQTPEVFVRVEGLSKSYAEPGFWFAGKRKCVFENISLAIRRGGCTGLVGLSGAGKSTLARILLGLEEADSGTITIDGMPLRTWRKRNPGRMSVVFQDYTDSADPNRTVGQTVAEPLVVAGRRNGVREAVAHALERVGLPAGFARRWPHELSGGQLQRVCIARALITGPEFVVFDEALSSLDAFVQTDIVRLLETLKTPGAAWLFVSHDLQAVRALCTDVVVLEAGRGAVQLAINELAGSRHPFVQRLTQAFARKTAAWRQTQTDANPKNQLRR